MRRLDTTLVNESGYPQELCLCLCPETIFRVGTRSCRDAAEVEQCGEAGDVAEAAQPGEHLGALTQSTPANGI